MKPTNPSLKTRQIILGLTLAMIGTAAADAQGLGSIAENLTSNAKQFPSLVGMIFQIAGFWLAGSGLLKIKKSQEEKGGSENTLGKGAVNMAIGIALLGLPEVIGIGLSTFLGGGEVSNSIEITATSRFGK